MAPSQSPETWKMVDFQMNYTIIARYTVIQDRGLTLEKLFTVNDQTRELWMSERMSEEGLHIDTMSFYTWQEKITLIMRLW